MFYSQRLQYFFERCACTCAMHSKSNSEQSISALSVWTAQCTNNAVVRTRFLIRLRDRLGTKPREVNNFDKSKRRSLLSAPRVDIIGKPGPDRLGLFPSFQSQTLFNTAAIQTRVK